MFDFHIMRIDQLSLLSLLLLLLLFQSYYYYHYYYYNCYHYIYIHKVVISVCLFVCPIITQKPPDRFASSFDWRLGRPTEMLLA